MFAAACSFGLLLCPQDAPAAPAPTVDAARQAMWDEAKAKMKPYEVVVPGTEVRFTMLPIAGGVYRMGSPDDEAGRRGDEGPQRWVAVDPFWLGKCEVTWDEYEQWASSLEVKRRSADYEASKADSEADAVSRPTPPYVDMTFGMGKEGYPAIGMTQHAAIKYCEWLSSKLGNFHRLPSEAEWEWACRAGTTTPYGFGDGEDIDEYAWHRGNSDGHYHQVGKKKPNPWGLHDMHGNVSEWCLDQMAPYAAAEGLLVSPLVRGEDEYPQVVRGGSWKERASRLRSAARRGSSSEWKMRDPQIPQSIWYFTDAQFNGFRVLRPYLEPTAADRQKYGSHVVDQGR
ncbi:MAG: formylglycine-generating enzyme family protein [Planctomycetota bacterium]